MKKFLLGIGLALFLLIFIRPIYDSNRVLHSNIFLIIISMIGMGVTGLIAVGYEEIKCDRENKRRERLARDMEWYNEQKKNE